MTATTTADWLTIGTVTGPHATEHTGTVPFTMNANAGAQRSATVTLSYDFGGSEPATKEVTVTQAVAQYTVTYNKNDNGASGEMSDDDSPYNYGSTVTVLENEFTAPTGKVFDHWSTASDGGDTYDPDDEFTIIGNVTLYAQWRSLHTYTLVTSTDQIVPGKHYIIANSKTAGSSYYAMGGQNSNYRNQVQRRFKSTAFMRFMVWLIKRVMVILWPTKILFRERFNIEGKERLHQSDLSKRRWCHQPHQQLLRNRQ